MKGAGPTRRRVAAAAAAMLIALSGCQSQNHAGEATPAATSPATSRYDGSYRMDVVWADVDSEGCVDDVKPGVTYKHELVLRDGVIELWGWTSDDPADRELVLEGTYRFFESQLQFGDPAATFTVDFSYDGTKLTMSNLRNGECGDRIVWTTQPWIRG